MIAANLGMLGSRLTAVTNGGAAPAGAPATGVTVPAPPPPPPPPPAPAPVPTLTQPLVAFQPATLLPQLLQPALPLTPTISVPFIPRIPPILPPIQVPTRPLATQLARSAINQLNNADTPSLQEALNALRSRNLTGDAVIGYLERKVRIGEVLGSLAADWAATTKTDFADAFQMQPDRLPVMDDIVSIAILNDRDLEAEVRAENTQAATGSDLLQNRKIVWQYPDAGTTLQPPYVILIAVDYQETAGADQVWQSISSQLGPYQGFQLPKSVISRLP